MVTDVDAKIVGIETRSETADAGLARLQTRTRRGTSIPATTCFLHKAEQCDIYVETCAEMDIAATAIDGLSTPSRAPYIL